MNVYCLEKVYGEGDSNAAYDLIGIYKTSILARKAAKTKLEKLRTFVFKSDDRYSYKEGYGIINERMTEENDYCILAKLGDRIETECAEYAHFGGFVIWEMEVQ